MIIGSNPKHVFRVNAFGPGVMAAYSGRSFDTHRRSLFLEALGIAPEDVASIKQVHGCAVVSAGKPPFDAAPAPEADALVTRSEGIAMAILTADCIPAFFWEPVRRTAGIAHAGWRGLAQGVLRETVGRMGALGADPGDLRVFLGPFIRACCYEVSADFAQKFPGHFQSKLGGKGMLDLGGAAREQLMKAGIPASRIEDSGLCTACRTDEFYSFRREGTAERMVSVIQIRGATA